MPPKRKSDGAASGSRTKKAKNTSDYTEAKDLVSTLIEGAGDVEINPSEARVVAEYTRWLEGELAATKPKERTLQEIEATAEKLRNVCVSGIRKQMTWKPSCKMGGVKWSYDGVCADPVIFGSMLDLDVPPKWKMHKYTATEFEDVMGSIEGSARYDTLRLCGNVSVQYQPDEGTFKMSGLYGVLL